MSYNVLRLVMTRPGHQLDDYIIQQEYIEKKIAMDFSFNSNQLSMIHWTSSWESSSREDNSKSTSIFPLNVNCVRLIHKPHLTHPSDIGPLKVDSCDHFVSNNQWVAFAILIIIQLVCSCPPWRKRWCWNWVLLRTLCVVNPYPQHFVMRLNTIRLQCLWCLLSLTIRSYIILQLFIKKVSFYQVKVIYVIWCPYNLFNLCKYTTKHIVRS